MESVDLLSFIRRELMRVGRSAALDPSLATVLEKLSLAVEAVERQVFVAPRLNEAMRGEADELARQARAIGASMAGIQPPRAEAAAGVWSAAEAALAPLVDSVRHDPTNRSLMNLVAPLFDAALRLEAAAKERTSRRLAEQFDGFVARHTSPAREGHDIENLEDRLARYLRSRFAGCRQLRVCNTRTMSHGSKDTVICDVETGGAPAFKLVFRMDLPISVTGTSVVEEFELMRKLHAAGLEVPAPQWIEPRGGGVTDHAFMVVEYLRGSVGSFDIEGGGLTGESCRQLAEFAARLHALKEPFPHAAPWRLDGMPTMLAHFHDWWRTLEHPPTLSMEIAFEWLFRNQAMLAGPMALVHGDLSHRNILIHEGSLSGVLDWETWHLGHPAEDLGYCRPSVLAASVSWEEFMGWYCDAGGMPVSEDALFYCEVWGHVRNCLYSTIAEGEFLRGRTDSLYLALTGSVDIPRMEAAAIRLLLGRVGTTHSEVSDEN